MKVGLISDTHDNIVNVDKALRVFASKQVELVVHLGDIISPFTLLRFAESGLRFHGVFGNNDGDRHQLTKIALRSGMTLEEQPAEFEVEGLRVLLLHGKGAPDITLKLARSYASSGNYDVVLFGHTHRWHLERRNGVLLLNPGSAYGMLFSKPTAAILDLPGMNVEKIELGD